MANIDNIDLDPVVARREDNFYEFEEEFEDLSPVVSVNDETISQDLPGIYDDNTSRAGGSISVQIIVNGFPKTAFIQGRFDT